MEVNNKLIKEIAENFPSIIANEAFENEHSIEVQLPFIQNLFMPDGDVVPIMEVKIIVEVMGIGIVMMALEVQLPAKFRQQ